MNQKAVEEEKASLMMKFFDYAECPIQEWIAEYLQTDVSEVFPDYQDNSDVLGFQCEINNKHYEGFLVVMEASTDNYVDKYVLGRSEKYKKTCSMLFDAVHQVFPAVVSTVSEKYKDKLKGFRPLFDNNTMSFGLYRINQSVSELQVAVEAKRQLLPYLMNHNEEFDEKVIKDIKDNIEKCDKVIERNTKDVLDAEEIQCKELNEKLKEYTRLYIAVEESEDAFIPTDASLSRLPVFGLSYQDPDEETLIDKLKKEMNVVE